MRKDSIIFHTGAVWWYCTIIWKPPCIEMAVDTLCNINSLRYTVFLRCRSTTSANAEAKGFGIERSRINEKRNEFLFE